MYTRRGRAKETLRDRATLVKALAPSSTAVGQVETARASCGSDVAASESLLYSANSSI
jgi:hypothetical protein